jgi:hypothetical protein
MARTFSMLAAILLAFILVTIGVGFWSMSLSWDEHRELKLNVFMVHYCLGLFTAIGILFVHCLIFIYFLGTGRWVKEVTLAYQMPDEPHHKRTRELKRTVFPAALFAMLIGIATAAAGAGRHLQEWPWYVHLTLALLTLAINLWAFRVEYACVSENAGIIAGVLDDVDRIRAARGLGSNAEALDEEERLANARRSG